MLGLNRARHKKEPDMNAWFAKYAKVLPLMAGGIVLVVQAALSDNVVNLDEKIAISLAVVGAVNTYIVPNLVGGIGRYAKGIVNATTAVLIGLAGWMVNGMSAADWWALLIAAATAAGVIVLPSVKHPDGA